MNAKVQTAWGLGATAALALLDEMIIDSGMMLLGSVAILALASATIGRHLPLFLRVFATGVTFYLGFVLCLVGRTMGPGFTGDTAQMAFVMFALYAGLPALALLRIWRGRLRIAVVGGIFPVSLAAACAVAAYEEYQFIEDHPHGAGATARWTVSQHWLAYDAEKQQLLGSD